MAVDVETSKVEAVVAALSEAAEALAEQEGRLKQTAPRILPPLQTAAGAMSLLQRRKALAHGMPHPPMVILLHQLLGQTIQVKTHSLP